MVFNPGNAENMAGLDTISASTRVRASTGPVTFSDSTGSVTVAASPLGVNYIDGIGTPYSTSVSGSTTSITLGASKFLTGVIVLTCTSSYTSTTDTAANLYTACTAVSPSGVQAGDYVSCLIMNDSTSSCTIVTGTGVTSANASTTSIAASTSRYCLFRFNTATSVNMYY